MNGEIKYGVSINGILFGSKEWSADRCYNMDEPWKHFAKWKKPDTKGHILFDSTYRKCTEWANEQEQKVDSGVEKGN